MNYKELSLALHEKHKGKLSINSKVPVKNKDDLSTAYTPGVAEPCMHIYKNKEDIYKYTIKSNTVAVITDGSAVLGLGNIGPEASLPVMEGKCVLFKEFAGVDAFPIAISTQDVEEFIKTVKLISPIFGGINLEDISAPRCFEIESRLKKELPIPVMHDDQHGTAVVVLAGLINSLKITKKSKDSKIVVCGAGAAGTAVIKLLLKYGFKDIIALDSQGIISRSRTDLDDAKKELTKITNKNNLQGSLKDAIKNRDVFIGLSAKNLLNSNDIKTMNKDSIIFAMANPDPEIMPDEAKKGGAKIIATGRSDFPNQINNVLAFPGIFRGALDARTKNITDEMKIKAAEALASHVKNPSENKIIPNAFDLGVSEVVANAVKSCA